MSAWEDLKKMALECRRCELAKGRTNVVFGEGDPRAEVLFVGEGPGRDEDLTGRPFVGAAGKLLTKLLEEIVVLRRSDVYIANIVKCRPPDNRDPKPEEIEACREYLLAQIAQIRPKMICTLGRHSLHTLVDPNISISREHGKPRNWNGLTVLPMYHPAAALYKRQLLELLEGDFRKLKELKDRGYK